MKFGLVAGVIPKHLPYADIIQKECDDAGFSACLAYSIAWHESICGEVNKKWCAADVLSSDNGHGLFQLTSSWPEGTWTDPTANTRFALSQYLIPSMAWFASKGLRGEALARCVAAGFNEGAVTAWDDHLGYGNVDIGTTGHDYAEDVYHNYTILIAGQDPDKG